MAKRELFDHRWTGPLMRSLHHVSVDRADGLASYDEGIRLLREGEVVGIFPEATISRSFELKEFKTGATRMAAGRGRAPGPDDPVGHPADEDQVATRRTSPAARPSRSRSASRCTPPARTRSPRPPS